MNTLRRQIRGSRNASPEYSPVKVRESGAGRQLPRLKKLERIMARPPGCSFLGARATTLNARLQSQEEEPIQVILDSGSDITLISQKVLNAMSHSPRPRSGQKVKLIQVTGTATISGYVPLDLYFETLDGPVKMFVEAYVVKEGETKVVFGASGREIHVPSFSDSTGPRDEDGHAFRVAIRTAPSVPDMSEARRERRRHAKQRHLRRPRNERVQALETVVIPPGASHLLRVGVTFPKGVDCMYVERLLLARRDSEQFYDQPIRIHRGDVVGFSRNPNTWLDRPSLYSSEQQAQILAHASLLRTLAQDPSLKTGMVRADTSELLLQADSRATEEEPLAEDPLEGGPKNSEVAPDDIAKSAYSRSREEESSRVCIGWTSGDYQREMQHPTAAS
ncbi:hypothetical protein GY45DRAFT_639113 [Cubamyces sp. BRFM 1775]|nr:hypothetical protein GY45DRAFT_639113 [Cubamyces sp. BRFM 1775]